jgi:hypothetical protein
VFSLPPLLRQQVGSGADPPPESRGVWLIGDVRRRAGAHSTATTASSRQRWRECHAALSRFRRSATTSPRPRHRQDRAPPRRSILRIPQRAALASRTRRRAGTPHLPCRRRCAPAPSPRPRSSAHERIPTSEGIDTKTASGRRAGAARNIVGGPFAPDGVCRWCDRRRGWVKRNRPKRAAAQRKKRSRSGSTVNHSAKH